jgi:hypothetical protein
MVHRALRYDDPAVVASYAWDRLIVDPLPGPRSVDDFDNLRAVGRYNYAFTGDTMPKGRAGSTMPRLAESLPNELLLLDPDAGAVGMREQILELINLYNVSAVEVVDVGGDAVARPGEPGLRSPLADGLVLAACRDLPAPVSVLIAGPGLDGEIPEATVLATPGLSALAYLRPSDVEPFRSVLDWHPSEATALLAAAALGLRGVVEVRDSGLVVKLTDRSAGVSTLPLSAALAVNALASSLGQTTGLDDAEDVARTICGFSEIDYERRKAERPTPAGPHRITRATEDAVDTFEHDAAARGIDFVTFRRIAEATALDPGSAADLRAHLVATRPDHLAWPLWSLRSLAA